jgi:alkylation response protein AidB-like acyl-CoA dehydrogenase
MDFRLDDEQEMIVQTVRRFADRELRTWAADADRDGAPPDKLQATARDLGFYLDAVPADADGLLEGSYSHTTRALRGVELGRGCAALAALLETNVEPALAVGTWGSDAAKKALFASLASGGIAAYYHDHRSAFEVEDDGAAVRISGKLGPAPAVGAASHVVVSTRDLVALVPLDGVRREAIAPSGWRAAKWGIANLAASRIPAELVLARGAAAADATAKLLAWARVSLASRAAGVAAAAIEHAENYGKERVQLGQPIGMFESLIRLRDDALTGVAAVRLMVLHAAWLIDAGDPGAFDAASRARVLANDVVTKSTIDGVQLFGGYGFVNDYPVEKLMRDARAFEALYGDERLGRILAAKAV